MQTLRLAVLVCLAFAVSEIKGGDYFDLGDALDDGPPTTKKPLPTKKPGSDGGFHLEDAFGEDGFAPKPKPGGGNATSPHAKNHDEASNVELEAELVEHAVNSTYSTVGQHSAETQNAHLQQLHGHRAEMRKELKEIHSEITLLRQSMNANTYAVERLATVLERGFASLTDAVRRLPSRCIG